MLRLLLENRFPRIWVPSAEKVHTRPRVTDGGVRSSWTDNEIYGSPVILVPTNALARTVALLTRRRLERSRPRGGRCA